LAVSDAPLLAQTAPTEAPATQPSAASPTADAEAPPATQPSPEASAEADASAADPPGAPDADALLADLLGEADRPSIAAPPPPVRAPIASGAGGPPAEARPIDARILGVAPGQDPPKLLPEGTFIVERAGRIAQTSDGSASLFVFEADDADAPEAPMILMPCGVLESMEDLTHRRDDQAVFLVSGRVHTYRGANYLLPMKMTVRIDRNNLMP
ncbi:MAG: hypothetical protein AAF612_12190, partial [Planctomycetota bacterium]